MVNRQNNFKQSPSASQSYSSIKEEARIAHGAYQPLPQRPYYVFGLLRQMLDNNENKNRGNNE